MKRRDFIKIAGSATGAVLATSSVHGLRLDPDGDSERADIPSLEDLAGGWKASDMVEQLPALSNFHGSLEATRNLLGVQNYTVPPFAQGGEAALLSLNGEAIQAEFFRWFPYQVQRKAEQNGVTIESTLRMPFEDSGMLFRLDIVNGGPAEYSTTLAIDTRAAIRRYDGKWLWETPRPRERDLAAFEFSSIPLGEDHALVSRDTGSQSAVAFVFSPAPDRISPCSTTAISQLTLKPGERISVWGAMATGAAQDSAIRRAAEWKASFTSVWDEARRRWEERYLAAFLPENRHFSGNLPTLKTSDPVIWKLYYSSAVSLLCLERTNLHPQYPRVFVTASPRWATTLVYFWDTSFFATLWALLDPAAMRSQLKLFLERNIHTCYAIDFQSLETVGPWYSANDYSVFRLVTTYIYVSGDEAFLDEGVAGDRKVIDYLEEMAHFWQKLTKSPSLLANYGDASNLLETVPTYIEEVPSMNAANVWMLRYMARIQANRGEAARAHELNQLSDRLAAEVLTLYVDGKGFWACRLTDGREVEVRHCIDFFTTIDTMKQDLGPERIAEMIAFANRELWTPNWLRALSLEDAAANVATRADHGSTGSYDAWPALTAEALFMTGRKAVAMDRWRSVEPAVHEGPFGQSHYVATEVYPVRKALSFGQDYFASASGSFAEVLLRTLFGFSPGPGQPWSPSSMVVPRFEGQLRNLRYAGRLNRVSIRQSPG